MPGPAQPQLSRAVGAGRIFKESTMQIEPQDHERIYPAESRPAWNVLLHWMIVVVFMTALIGGAALVF